MVCLVGQTFSLANQSNRKKKQVGLLDEFAKLFKLSNRFAKIFDGLGWLNGSHPNIEKVPNKLKLFITSTLFCQEL